MARTRGGSRGKGRGGSSAAASSRLSPPLRRSARLVEKQPTSVSAPEPNAAPVSRSPSPLAATVLVPASPESPVAVPLSGCPVFNSSKSPATRQVPLKPLPRPSFLLPTPPNPNLPFHSSCSSLPHVHSNLPLLLSLFLVLFLILLPFH